MKCEYLQFPDGTVRVTAVFESREDMEKFKDAYDQFAALLPEKKLEPGASEGKNDG